MSIPLNNIEIVLATKNPHKITEINQILGKKFICIPYTKFIDIQIPEHGKTLLENSLFKAAFVHRIINKPCLAEDSGLFIDKLNGAPGVFSSRYGRDDKERIERVLKELGNSRKRTARFCAVFVYYEGTKNYKIFEGECPGRIALRPKGEGGFGYDPIFIPDSYNKTFAELGPEIKNRISHRAKALKKFIRYIRGITLKSQKDL